MEGELPRGASLWVLPKALVLPHRVLTLTSGNQGTYWAQPEGTRPSVLGCIRGEQACKSGGAQGLFMGSICGSFHSAGFTRSTPVLGCLSFAPSAIPFSDQHRKRN